MRVYNTLFESYENLDFWIERKNFDPQLHCLVSIHTCELDEEKSVELAKHIKKLMPFATVNGCNTSGIIYNGEIYEDKILISIKEFEYGKIYSKIQSIKELNSYEIAESIAEQSKIFSSSFGILLFDFDFEYNQINLFNVTQHLNTLLPETHFVGGKAGHMSLNDEVVSYLFDENGSYHNSYLVNFISGEHVLAYIDITTGHPAISDVFTITKEHADYIDEIDNVPAVEWFSKKLGLEEFEGYSNWNTSALTDILVRFPLVLEGYTSSTRFVQFDKATNQIRLYGDKLDAGQKFRMGYLSPLKSAEEIQETCQNLQMISAETIFCYSCLFRKAFSSATRWELSAFKNTNICGAFLLGEIGTKNSQVQFLNGSSNLFTLAEKASRLDIDLSAFDHIQPLFEANDDLINSITALGKNVDESIFSAFIKCENQIKNRFINKVDEDFASIPQFLKKQVENSKEQICLISIENFEKHQEELDEETLELAIRANRKNILTYFEKHYSQYHFNFYRYDASNFFFTIEEKISEATFLALLRGLFTYCGKEMLLDGKVVFINDITYTVNGLAIQQLLDASKRKDLSNEQRRFNHCDKINEDAFNLHAEFQMVAALKEIIKTNAIIPYFQGIYDNKKNYFHMYEALMRLQHPDGRTLFPNDFMDIAKKYDLYLPLSLCMVTKVLELFKDRKEIITINISAYDILSDTFREKVFEELSKIPNPQNFVFELLETEAFEDLESLRNFIYQLKQYGCRIAVDDFGAGYSNFIEFGNLEVDFLKINGSLTKLLGTDFNYGHILNSIAFMGEKMSVKLIAEFVETAATQKLLIQSGVHYSQGYFFSKPMPFSELKVVSEENMLKVAKNVEATDEQEKESFSQTNAKKDNFILILGAFCVALFTVISVLFYVDFTQNEFKKINDSFLVEIATGLSDKIALFTEESEISLQIMTVAMSEYAETAGDVSSFSQELFDLNNATKFDATYVSYNGKPAVDSIGNILDIPIDTLYGQVVGKDVLKLPIYTNSEGVKILVFASNLFLKGEKVGEIYGTYKVKDLSTLLALKSFGGEAFYHISQVDGTPIYLSGSASNASTSGDIYAFIGSLDIFNGHTPASIKKDMEDGKTVLLNYYLNGEERSAVMVRIPNTDWCVVSIVLNTVNTQMLKNNGRGTLAFILFITLVYAIYFFFTTRIFSNHRKVILETLEASRALSNSLQLSIEKDSLTGTYSRSTAIEKISNVIAGQKQKGVVHALAILDIDNFKYINDTYGHHTGDIYLQSFVSAVKLSMKPGNILGRLGGDEFLLLLNDIEDMSEVSETFDKIFANIHKIALGGVDLDRVSVSAGIVMITENEKTYEELMIEADNTLYDAKRRGKNKYLFANPEFCQL